MTILCYHTVDPSWRSPLAVSPARFAEHCEWLAGHRVVVPLDRMLSGDASRRWVAMTFDDGFASLHEHGLETLRRHALPATVFVVAGTLTAPGLPVDWITPPPERTPATLSRQQLLELLAQGVRVGSHSWAHRDLTTLDERECVEDLRASRELLEDVVGQSVPHLAYPKGRHDETVRRAARAAGYSHAFALPERRESGGRYAVPRVGVYPDNGVATLRLKCAPAYLRARASRAYPVLRLAARGRRHTLPA